MKQGSLCMHLMGKEKEEVGLAPSQEKLRLESGESEFIFHLYSREKVVAGRNARVG